MTKKLNLMLHCGADHATREQVANVTTPQPEGRHFPIGHTELIDRIEQQLGGAGFSTVNEAYGLTADGARMFGMMQLSHDELGGDGGHSVVLGVRNSHDKTFSASIVAGSGVFVCDNLAFSGEIKVARKHTINILRDLNALTVRAVSKLAAAYRQQETAFEAYKAREISDDRAKALIVDSLQRKVFPVRDLPGVVKEWETPSHEEFAEKKNVWRLFNAVTEVAKGWSATNKLQRTQLLHGLCDAECGLLQLSA